MSPSMGTAPTDPQSPVLPDSAELVDHAVRVLQQLGMERTDALNKVMHVAANVKVTLWAEGCPDAAWLDEVIQAVKNRLPVPEPSDTERIGQDNAHGNGRHRGGPE